MDFWSRLLGGTGVVRQANPANPQQRLARFKRTYDQIRTTYQKSPLLQNDSTAAETIRSSFQRLTTIIQDESRAPAPHLCLQFAASAQIYTTISRIGAVAQHQGIIREAVSVFGALIDSEEEEFLANERFAHALMVFVDRTSGSGNLFVGEDTECEIVELLFGIAAKIRLQPEILPVWFSNRHQSKRASGGKKEDFVGVTSKEDFPLCYQLIDHVHHEGRMGDFARTGLLYVFESASKSEELERWIVASDMPTLMATGLGALYSQLSRKLSIIHPSEDLPIILTLSDYKDLVAPEEAEGLYTEYLQGHLATFLSYLTFWQDVLEHCRSVDVRQTLLDHYQILFLQQLLYPSMLESSDVDGGSSVAVLTYLRQILDALDHVELVNLVLQYLLALPEPKRARSPTAIKRRSSLMLLTEPADGDEGMNPSLFNLIDLLQSSVTSENPQTVISALKLATVILGKNHPYAIDSLLQTNMPAHQEVTRTHGALNAEVEAYMALAVGIAGSAGLDESFDSHLKDALRQLESHVCSSKLLDLGAVTGSTATKPLPHPVGPQEIVSHIVRLDDSFLNKMLAGLSTFLTNNVEVNLALTETFMTLMTCAHFRLEGWAAVDSANYILPTDSPDSEIAEEADPSTEALRMLKRARRQPTWSAEHAPALLRTIEDIKKELDSLKTTIPDLDQLLVTRKEAFRLHTEITDAMQNTPMPIRPSMQSQDSQQAPANLSSPPQQKEASLGQRFLDAIDGMSPSPSRSHSRGRERGSISERRPGVTSSPSLGEALSRAGDQILSQYAPGLASPPANGSTPQSRSRQRGGEAMKRQGSDMGPTGGARGLLATPSQASQIGYQKLLLNDVLDAANDGRLKRKIRFPVQSSGKASESDEADGEEGLEMRKKKEGKTGEDDEEDEHKRREASLSHILTNAVILQEFVLEIVAVMQVRASMFGEVIFA